TGCDTGRTRSDPLF
ncbi:glycerol-3-phosphate regulon repressor, partial [Escherichia coli EC1864]